MIKGVTLIEVLVVLVIIGIGVALFYSVLFVNWTSTEKQIVYIDLQMEADTIMEQISFDAKAARMLSVGADGKSVTFSFPAAAPATYSFNENNEIQKKTGETTKVISAYIDFDNSSFKKDGDMLKVELLLSDKVFGKKVELNVSTNVLPRNLL